MKKVILVIRDGWGYRESCEQNAICEAGTPQTDKLMNSYPHTLLDASGEAVGLPAGYQGNSEVGHLTIGAGRINFQPMVRINKAIETGDFFRNEAFLAAIDNCRTHGTSLHLIGLLQSKGVHAHENHLYALLDLCKQQNFHDVLVHVITDGRDAPVHDGRGHIEKLMVKLNEFGFGSIATLSGRYYAMDRDKRWDRTRQAYDCIAHGKTEIEFTDIKKAVQDSYAADKTDEFIIPQKKQGYEGFKPYDSVIFYNFRTDRPRQLTQAIIEPDFFGWEREPLDVFFITMTEYYKPMQARSAFKDIPLTHLLGEIVSDAGLKQLRISETEKYAHVTFFFNGQVEQPFPDEERILVQSPKVATYDLQPEMSAYEVTDKLVAEIKKNVYDFMVVNLVNGDLVGHTGVIDACHTAVRSVDECVGRIAEVGLANEYVILIFADHGNIEDQTPAWRTSHTTNPVPLIVVSDAPEIKKATLKKGRGLQDIAPSVLALLDLNKPKEMTGENILGDRG